MNFDKIVEILTPMGFEHKLKLISVLTEQLEKDIYAFEDDVMKNNKIDTQTQE